MKQLNGSKFPTSVMTIAGIILLCARISLAYAQAPVPLLGPGHPVDWWFVFKFNAAVFPNCSGGATRQCVFGGTPQNYAHYGQQFVYASSDPKEGILQRGSGCLGANVQDPLGATVEQIYTGALHYVVWNDQFYDDPEISGCTNSCGSPWGHSKGMIAWDDSGAGMVLQVTTPSWPAAGSKAHPRQMDGNTLGCVTDDNVEVSQHFFALRLTKADVINVLGALENASVVTNLADPQLVSNGGPPDVQSEVQTLGGKSMSTKVIDVNLSTGVRLIGKPSALHVPPWQLVSSVLGGAPLRTATWWAPPKIPSTTGATAVQCWDKSLTRPGPVEIATTGHWLDQKFGLEGGPAPNNNHAKIGVTIGQTPGFAIFGDLNQQGDLSGETCGSSQNGRGGLFFVVQNQDLVDSVTDLLQGDTAPSTEGASP